MTKNKVQASPANNLRQQAEAFFRENWAHNSEDIAALSLEQVQHVVQELRVHQIELEMQNEELRRVQSELEDSRGRYFDLFDLAPVGYVTISEKGLILEANLTAAALLGVVRSALVKQPLTRYICLEDQDIYYLHRRQLFDTGTPQVCELRLVRKDAVLFWVRLDASPAQDANGAAVCRATLSDITERKRVEQEIQKLNAELEQRIEERTRELREVQEQLVRQERLAVLGQLAGGVGHELRNPLGVISNAVYYLGLIQPDANEKVKEYLAMIQQETHTADKIITDLLEFSRPKLADLQRVVVADLVRYTLERFPAPENVLLTLNLPEALPVIGVDPRQITQVLGNLVLNACQAMPAGGKLTISVAQQAEAIAIAIQDTGMGIPPENMHKLFEPLFTTKPKGIGLGLAVSKKLAEANGGRIEVQSEPGKGSTFTVYLSAKQ